ncbi:MAG: hypothetical protein IJ473_01325 [Alphaproteobacteria bacterium]|nr:hypothetical protein [Alphaproteobacteria bacterium]MBQ8660204.1 hypothetical protein [Alphaproteobacteria bacterium]
MKVTEKSSTSDKNEVCLYRNYKNKKLKSQRENIDKYNKLLAKAEDLGVIAIEFDHDFSYNKRIKILKKIIERQK